MSEIFAALGRLGRALATMWRALPKLDRITLVVVLIGLAASITSWFFEYPAAFWPLGVSGVCLGFTSVWLVKRRNYIK